MKKKTAYRNLLLEIVMILLSVMIVVPLLVVVFGSFKTAPEAGQFNFMLPKRWILTNYREVIEKAHLLLAMKNSTLITVSVVVVTTFVCLLGAFVIARRKDKLSRFLNTFFSLGLIVPMSIVPTILLLQYLHLNNTKTGMICVLVGSNISWGMFLMTNFVDTIPKELDEAAFVDGCRAWQLIWYVILPLLRPVMMTNIVIIGMSAWNDLQTPLYLLNSSKNITMPLTVYNFKGMYFSEWNLIFADMVLVALPMVILYIICQRYIVAGITAGAVKG